MAKMSFTSFRDRIALHWTVLRSLQLNSPRPFARHSQRLAQKERWAQAARIAHAGLDRFPFALDLEELYREAWAHAGPALIKDALSREGDDALGDYAAIVRLHLEFDDHQTAAHLAAEALKRDERSLTAWTLEGEVALARFRDEHLAAYGRRALEAFKHAHDLDPRDVTACLGLARAYLEIGGTRQAAFHALLAIELAPDDEEPRELYERIRALPVDRRRENELLWEAEFRDQAAVLDEAEPESPHYVSQVEDGLCELSLESGVRTVAIRHRGLRLVAEDGSCRGLKGNWETGFVDLASVLRTEGSKVAKRLDLGRFLEADLITDEGRAIAVAAGPSVMLMTVDEEVESGALAASARDQLSAHTASWTDELEWVRGRHRATG